MTATTMRRLALAVTAALALQGCGSEGSGGVGGPAAPTRTVSIAPDVVAVAGYGGVVAMLHYAYRDPVGFEAILRLARRDAAAATELVDLGDLPVRDVTVDPLDDLTVTDRWVTLCSGGKTAVISLETIAPEHVATFDTGAGARAIASGRWLLSAQGGWLAVRDLASPGTGYPQVGAAMSAGAPVTGLAAAPDGFYVFTQAGYGHLSMAGDVPSYQHVASDALRLFAKAHLYGAKLYAGGPSPRLGGIRVARIDVAIAAAPVLESSAEVEASWGDFAYDGAGAYVVLGRTPDLGVHRLTVLRESRGAIDAGTTRDLAVMQRAASISHAWQGILYAATLGGASWGELGLYAIP